ncbi:MAG TPA: hypothetical protein VLA74_08195 [Nitrososphaeraceae archaeon]|nr:hypothetical protein [Nitrososphaeraceae archaeon]
MRNKQINALTEQIKSLLWIDPLPIRKYDSTYPSVLLPGLLYQIVV